MKEPHYSVYQLFHVLRDLYTKAAEREGLSYCQYVFLDCVHSYPGISQDDAGKVTYFFKSNLTILVQQMLKLGLLERKHTQTDKRKYQLYLTEKGESVYTRLSELTDKALAEKFAPLPEKQLHFLTEPLCKMKSSI